MNSMKTIEIEKITLNMGVGKPGQELEKAKVLLQTLTGEKAVETKTKKRIPAWSLRPGLAIGTKVTLRGKKVLTLLLRLLGALDKRLSHHAFDHEGNFAFGIKEYLDIPGIDYLPDVGIMGFEVAVTLQRKGFRLKRRKLQRVQIPLRHRVSKNEGIAFAKEKLQVRIIEEEGEEE